jgi:branched-chain amino acid transport system ATP-binding protein
MNTGLNPLLVVSNLGINFGGLRALDKVNFTVDYGQIVGLIGPNGAGKTTVFNLLTAVYTPTQGSMILAEYSLAGKKTFKIAKFGIGRTFQNIRLFKDLTVLDNVKAALHNEIKYNLFSAVFRMRAYWRDEEAITKKAMDLLSIFGLDIVSDWQASNLPYGQQRKLEIVRALATDPKILLLDEPAAGMNHTETHELMETIRFVREKFGIAILLIEHDMNLVMGICEKIVVLDYGTVIAEGTPEQIKSNKKVIGAYLGQ